MVSAEAAPSAAPSFRDVQVGDVVAGYVLKDAVGEGGMGRVFLAHDERLDRHVALKLLPPSDADDEGRGRFLREARALARIDHPNVVRVNASGVEGTLAWMSLEYIEGDPLDELLGGGPLDEETALLLSAQAARGLAAVHRVGVIHRDVKPSNLLIDDAGTLRVVDFGVALLTERGGQNGFVTQKGVAVGTPHFMAPEQARGGSVDARADAWGLGATLFTMLAGQPPFYTTDDEADLDVLARVLREPAPDVRKRAPGVSPETASLLKRLLAADADDRPGDLDEVAALLEACADHLSGRGPLPHIAPARRPTGEHAAAEDADAQAATPVEERAPPSSVLPRVALFAVMGALVVGAGGAGWFLASSQSAAGAEPLTTSAPPPLPAAEPEGPEADAAPDEGDMELTPGSEVPEPLPSPAEIEAREAEELLRESWKPGDDGYRAVMRLVELKTEPAQEALENLVRSSPRADEALTLIESRSARHHLRSLDWAVTGGQPRLAILAIRALTALRSTEALEILQRAESGHADADVRDAAKLGRQSIFFVEGEER